MPKGPSVTALAVKPPPPQPWNLNQDEVTLVKNQICKGATDEELKFCLTVARRYRLDPFKQQIWFVSRWDKDADTGNGKGRNVWTPQVGIYGLMHCAARDHRDYGTLSKPEYGPDQIFEIEGHKIKAPAWAVVNLWKKGMAEPSVGEAWFEEYHPHSWKNAHLFWARMPHRMIAKCAKAQAIREAYPDLGGLFVPEEMERMSEDYTRSGRQIVQDVPAGGSHDAGRKVLEEKLSGKRPLHADMAPIDVAGRVDERTTAEASTPEEPPKSSAGQPAPRPASYKGVVELDWTTETSPIVRGDLGEILTTDIEGRGQVAGVPVIWGPDNWWHLEPRNAETLRAACRKLQYQLKELNMKGSPVEPAAHSDREKTPAGPSVPARRAATGKGVASSVEPRTGSNDSTPVAVKGIIHAIRHAMTRNQQAMAFITIMVGKVKRDFCSFDKSINDELERGKKKEAVVYVKTERGYNNIVGLKSIGAQLFEADGKTRVALSTDREAGTKTLW